MKTWSSSFVALKNSLEGQIWAHLVEIEVNVNSTAYFTSHPETLSFNGNTYMPVPFMVGDSEQGADGQLASMTIDVANYRGMALRFAKDNDISLNNVTIRMINTSLTNSGQDDRTTLQILNAIYTNEIVRFTLGYNFTYDVEGPRVTYNRRDFPSLPHNANKFFVF